MTPSRQVLQSCWALKNDAQKWCHPTSEVQKGGLLDHAHTRMHTHMYPQAHPHTFPVVSNDTSRHGCFILLTWARGLRQQNSSSSAQRSPLRPRAVDVANQHLSQIIDLMMQLSSSQQAGGDPG